MDNICNDINFSDVTEQNGHASVRDFVHGSIGLDSVVFISLKNGKGEACRI